MKSLTKIRLLIDEIQSVVTISSDKMSLLRSLVVLLNWRAPVIRVTQNGTSMTLIKVTAQLRC